MTYYSTNNKSYHVSLKEAVIRGLAPDNGLFMPAQIPLMPRRFFETISAKSFPEIAMEVAATLIGGEVESRELERIVSHAVSFDAPLVEIEEGVFALELFHGPTLAFKDFGARFMSQLLRYFAARDATQITILVATSGDTGSAVANGFLGVEGIRVVVLYPSGKVSEIQERQFTTLGQNITALEVEGTFDDCQRLVKQAFMDADLKKELFLTSANSINIARLIPQSFYYFYAFSRLRETAKPVVFSVPSGNFGNLTAGILAARMGLPVRHFIAATNVNDIVPEYLHTRIFRPKESLHTISNAMDVGNPSNFVRLQDLYHNDHDRMTAQIIGYSFTDDETATGLKNVFQGMNYLLDPHGAVGYLGLKKYMAQFGSDISGIFLETAHPAKFRDVVEGIIGEQISMPPALGKFMSGKKRSEKIPGRYEVLREQLFALK
jgi:threonine synthase